MNIEQIINEANEKLSSEKRVTVVPGTSLNYSVGELLGMIEDSGYISEYSKIELDSGNELELYIILSKIDDLIDEVKDVEERLDEADDEEEILNLCFELERANGTV